MEGLFPKEEPLSFKIFKFWWFQSRIKIWILSVKIKIFYLKMRLSLTLEDRHRQTEALRALNFFVVQLGPACQLSSSLGQGLTLK